MFGLLNGCTDALEQRKTISQIVYIFQTMMNDEVKTGCLPSLNNEVKTGCLPSLLDDGLMAFACYLFSQWTGLKPSSW